MTDPLLVGAHGAIDRLMQLSRELRECPSCQGAGMVPLGEHRVTHDMAIDAGELSLEGTPCGCEFGPCDQCGGGGLVDSEVANEIDRAVSELCVDDLDRVGLALGTNGQFQGLLAGGTAYPHANAVLNVLAERDSLRARLAGIVPCETFSESECPKDGCKHCGWSEEAHYPEPIDAFSDWLTIDVSFKQGIVSDGATYVCAAYPDSIGVWTAYGGEALTPQPMWWFPYPEMPK